MSETQTINLGDHENIRDTKIRVHARQQKKYIIQDLFD